MPATSPWFVGSVVPLSWVNTDTAGNAQDAATVTLTVTLPDRSTAVITPAHDGLGQYSAKYTTTQAGHHVILWQAADTNYPGAWADSFEVQATADLTIVSLMDAKEILRLTGTTDQDSLLQGFNADATRVAELYCGTVVTRQVTEVVRSQGREITLGRPPVRTDLGTALDPSGRRDGSTTNGLVSITPLMTYGFMYDLDQLLVTEDGQIRHNAGLPFFYSSDPYPQYQAIYWAGRKVIDQPIYDGAQVILEHLWQLRRGGTSAQDVAAGQSVTIVPGIGFAVPNRAIQLFTTASGQASRAVFA